jgi:hypothetical protein
VRLRLSAEQLRALRPTAVVVYLAMCLREEATETTPGAPFPASVTTLAGLTNLSPPTIVDARRDLVQAGLVIEADPPGTYRLVTGI